MSERQTLSYLRNLLEERGIRPKNKLGQNFLIDLNLLDLIVRTAELTPEDLALEIGSGTGGLTTRLIEQAGAVVSVEVDPSFARMTEDAVDANPKVRLIEADILAGKNELNPLVLDTLRSFAMEANTQKIKLVANLPYSVATPVISNLLLSDIPLERMVVTVQWEIGERLTAEVGTKDFGALTVLVQSLAEVTLVRRLNPTVFWPRPKVDSAIVLIRPDAAKRAEVGDVQRFRAFLRDLYSHRRKNLRGGLASLPKVAITKAEISQKLQDIGLDGTIRAEALNPAQHLLLCRIFG